MPSKYEIKNGRHCVLTENRGELELPLAMHESLINDYCLKKRHIDSIVLDYGFYSRSNFEAYRRAIGFTRNSAPVQPGSEVSSSKPKFITETAEKGSLDEVLKTCSIDLKVWQVDDFNVKQLSSGSFIWTVYFKKNIQAADKLNIEEFKKELRAIAPHAPRINSPKENKGLLWECAIFDAHIGKLAIAAETGEEYDIKIASKVYKDAIDFSIAQAKNFNIEKVIFPIGQDFLHVDGRHNETTKGTRQDTDGKFSKIFVVARQLLIESIEKLKTIAPVDVVCLAGNHEEDSMFHLGDCLECRYWNDENVTVYNEPISRKYYQWGKNLIGYSHGDKTKIADLAVLMATESHKLWSLTKYRYWRLGHFHHQKLFVDEKSGVIVEILPSISATDCWHASQGYTKNIRGAVSSLFDKENGLVAKFYFNL